MRIRTGLIVTTAGVVSLIVSRPLAQGQSASGPSRHAPSTQPHHPAGGWGGPPMMIRDGPGGQGGQGRPFGGRPMRDGGPGFGRGGDRPRGDGPRGGEMGHAESTGDAKAIAELTKQVRALTEQVKELRQAIAGATEEQEGDDDDRGRRSFGRDGEERSFDRRDDHRPSRDEDEDRPPARRYDHRERRNEDDDRGPERFAPPPHHGPDHMSWHQDDRDRD